MSVSVLQSPARIRLDRLTSPRTVLADAIEGLLAVSRHALLALGVAAAVSAAFVLAQPDLRHSLEDQARDWLLSRQHARSQPQAPELPADVLPVSLAEPLAISRATAADPAELNRQQAAVAQWLSRRYRVAPEPISRLVQEAWRIGQQARLEPTLILAVMAIESRFNPFAQSPVGAQGLMQVMTRVHDDKYEAFGGLHAAFDPVSNLRVGVQVLRECIARAGSIEGGLKFYVGAADLTTDGGYAAKVMAEQALLRQVAAGRRVPVTAPLAVPAPVVSADSSIDSPASHSGSLPPAAGDSAAPHPAAAASATVASTAVNLDGVKASHAAGTGQVASREHIALAEPIL